MHEVTSLLPQAGRPTTSIPKRLSISALSLALIERSVSLALRSI